MTRLLLFLGTLGFVSCSAGGQLGDQHVYWVNSSPTSCVGRAPTKCLQVQKSETLDPSAWVTFQDSIKGFAFEQGYIYKILVRERQSDGDDHSEVSPSVEYTLVEILEKKQDKKFRIHGNWVLHKIKEETMLAHSEELTPPQLEVNVGEMRYGGNDGCNNFNGGLVEMGDRTIRFGIAAATRMMCPHMKIPDLFSTCLPEVRSWEVKEDRLQLFDAEATEVMQFRKIH